MNDAGLGMMAGKMGEPDAGARERRDCPVCGYRLTRSDESCLVPFPCNVRAFIDETFRYWRCPTCRSLHCFDVVPLDHYYAKYPFAKATLEPPFRVFYRNLCRRFLKHYLRPHHTLLDYGCANGLFGDYLKRRKLARYFGYEPYGDPDGLGNAATLDAGPFDFILLQDVVEHVEDPAELIAKMDRLLKPGGRILVGTPNADRLRLDRPRACLNEVHAPYHLHILTRDALTEMGAGVGWEAIDFFDRSYHDQPWFALNVRAVKYYQMMKDGTLDALFEPFDSLRALRSPFWLFLAFFGYWLSPHSDMAIMFRKPS